MRLRGEVKGRMDVELGRMCKRIIDYCRSRYIEQQVNALLKDKQFHSRLVYYCDPKDSPENCIILGTVYSGVCWKWVCCGGGLLRRRGSGCGDVLVMKGVLLNE